MATTLDSISPARADNPVASYASYEEAQRAVDRLSDRGFPVENADIVGSDLRLVEHITGRLTTGRAALAAPARAPGSACSSACSSVSSRAGRRGSGSCSAAC